MFLNLNEGRELGSDNEPSEELKTDTADLPIPDGSTQEEATETFWKGSENYVKKFVQVYDKKFKNKRSTLLAVLRKEEKYPAVEMLELHADERGGVAKGGGLKLNTY